MQYLQDTLRVASRKEFRTSCGELFASSSTPTPLLCINAAHGWNTGANHSTMLANCSQVIPESAMNSGKLKRQIWSALIY